jgi:hypothetical protein
MKTVRLKDLVGLHTLSAVETGYAGGRGWGSERHICKEIPL